EEYEVGGTTWDSVLKALNTALREHPFHTVRVAELRRWENSGDYTRIMAGEYIRRGSEAERPLRDDVREATDYYTEQAKAAAQTVGDAIGRATDAFKEAFRSASGTGGV
ncbi:MAG: peptidase M48, partial [Gemmatimonas sp.]